MLLGQLQNQLAGVLKRKPRLVSKAGLRYLRNRLNIQPPFLRTVDIMTTKACNCRCEHCFAESFTWKGRQATPLSTDEMVAAIGEFRGCGAFHFTLQGGEPFLHPDLDALVAARKPAESYITIVTNGAAVSREKLAHVYRLGVDKIAVSIDSTFSAEHDDFRG